MQQNQFMKNNENLTWISILLFSISIYFIDINYCVILFFWTINILLFGNTRRIPLNSYILSFIRRSFYFLPLLLPLLIKDFFLINVTINIKFYFLGISTGIILLLPRYRDLSILMSNEIIQIIPKKNKTAYISQIIILTASAICEEFFYRGFILEYGNNNFLFFNIFLSTFLFILHHYGVKWGDEFDRYDFIIQGTFSVISCILLISSHSLIPSILGHFILNLPRIIICVKSYYFNYCKSMI